MEIASKILSDITVHTKYAKYQPTEQRRETWEELVTRNMEMHIRKYPNLEKEIRESYKMVFDKKVLPSMRSLQFGGKPIEISPNRLYNCSYLPIDDWHAFGETMFLLLAGNGVGYSVQKHHIEQLPEIRKPNPDNIKRYLVNDSIEGWADAVKHLVKSYFKGGATLKFDFSDIRPKGAMLVTSGGKAPGPEPLKHCLNEITKILSTKQIGDKLSSIEVHDIICHIADAVLAGGIRRAALISLFSADDTEMIKSKTNFTINSYEHLLEDGPVDEQGEPVKVNATHTDEQGTKYYDIKVNVDEPGYGNVLRDLYWVSEYDLEQIKTTGKLPWYLFQPQRGRANNSISLVRSKITKQKFKEIWETVENSGAGEPGFYFTNDKDWGTNPCAEIALRPYQFCNLCEVNVSDVESQEDLNNRVRTASFIGTLQAGYTDFHYLRPIWKKTTEKDALLGVSMTGIASNAVLGLDMEQSAKVVLEENERVAKIIGIKKAARATAVKPAGTTSLVVGSSSGIHAWHNDYYIRRMRLGKNEAIYTYLSINHPELLEDDFFRPQDTSVLSIPQKAPEGAIIRTESVFELLERIKLVNETWVRAGHRGGMNSHNVSATVSVKDNEWEAVGEWMWSNRKTYNGISVLPYSNHTYKQAPFEDCTKEVYERLMKTLTNIDLTKVVEMEDNTATKDELACAGQSCDLI